MQRRGLYCPETERDSCGVGFVAHIRGQKSREIVEQALEVLRRLSHRAATGADPETGDGAGILLQVPHRFFKREGLRLGFDMPHRRGYGVGMVFLPSDPACRRACEQVLEEVVAEEGQRLLGWRDVPIDEQQAGPTARAVLPAIRQIYIARRRLVPTAFERKLYVIRKLTENRIRERAAEIDPDGRFHVASLSAETIVYKGLLLPGRLAAFYRDLDDPDFVAALAVVHSRFSTNTFPTWDLAQPLRFIAHNGEINTVQGNRNWSNARKSLLSSGKFGGRIDRLFPIIVPGKSDSAQFDNMLELLAPGRAHPAPRHDDDDPGGVGGEPGPGSRAGRLLPLRRDADGAVGRPRRHRVLRRPPGRRHPRPQRAAPRALPHHRRRPRHPRLRGRRARRAAAHGAQQGAPAAGPHVPRRHGVGPHRLRRGGQARGGEPVPVRALAARQRVRAAGGAERRGPAAPVRRRAGPPAAQRSATPSRTCACWSRRWPRTARSRSARWAPTRRWPRCRISRPACSPTSTSCSPRSPTRRSIRSASGW